MFSPNAYAHRDELIAAYDEIRNTDRVMVPLEKWQNLANLYEEDVQYHTSRGEVEEANKSQYLARATRLTIFGITNFFSKPTPTESDVRGFMDRINEDVSLYYDMDKKIVTLEGIKADVFRYAQNNGIPGSMGFHFLSEISKMQSSLFAETGDSESAKLASGQSDEFMGVSCIRKSEENPSVEYLTSAVGFFKSAFTKYLHVNDFPKAFRCIGIVVDTNKRIVELGGTEVGVDDLGSMGVESTKGDESLC